MKLILFLILKNFILYGQLDVIISGDPARVLKGQKVGGILIETSVKKNYLEIVVGVGLNVLMETYQNLVKDVVNDEMIQMKSFLDSEIEIKEEHLEKVRKDLSSFQEQEQIFDPIEQYKILSEMRKELIIQRNSNQVECFTIDLGFTAMLFAKGHRIRVQISSSNFPAFDRNLNTGKGFGDSQIIVAEQTIFHDSKYPSFINLPKVNR